jgi:aryl-alcohol dehydrogenase-like predicted oxidoreductase
MNYVSLGSTGIQMSRLGFGCSPLLGRVGRRDANRALSYAFDRGVTYFDTARSYGYGEGERLLGQFVAGRRHKVVIGTKFGITASEKSRVYRAAMPLVRGLLKVIPGARRMVRRGLSGAHVENGFAVKQMSASLDLSLRALGTDYIDVLFFHSAPVTILDDEEVFVELARLIQSGKIRAAGISCEQAVAAEVSRVMPCGISGVQVPFGGDVPESSSLMHADGGGALWRIANQPFGGILQSKHLQQRAHQRLAEAELPTDLRVKVRESGERIVSEVILNYILERAAFECVLPSMIQARHIDSNVGAIVGHRFTSEELDVLYSVMKSGDGLYAA